MRITDERLAECAKALATEQVDDALKLGFEWQELRSMVAELAAAREALRPFAQIADDGTMIDDDDADDQDWFRHDGASLSVGDFRRASAALAGSNEP